jgi:hypothetical protein
LLPGPKAAGNAATVAFPDHITDRGEMGEQGMPGQAAEPPLRDGVLRAEELPMSTCRAGAYQQFRAEGPLAALASPAEETE